MRDVFPAGAGMNRVTGKRAWAKISVPRRRGDEPLFLADFGDKHVCSPQARG